MTIMKIKDGYMLREVAGTPIAVAVGPAARGFNGMIRLNSSGAFLWRLLERGSAEAELAEEWYGIGRTEAEEHVAAFLELLRKNGLIDE
mgnify:CR=1 FL=1